MRKQESQSRHNENESEHHGRQSQEFGEDDSSKPGRKHRPDAETLSSTTVAVCGKCDGPSARTTANAANTANVANTAVSAIHAGAGHAAVVDSHDGTAADAADATCDGVDTAAVHDAESIWPDLVMGRAKFL